MQTPKPLLEGYLLKQSAFWKKWNSRYCRLVEAPGDKIELVWAKSESVPELGRLTLTQAMKAIEFPATLGPVGFAIRENHEGQFPKDIMLLRGLSPENAKQWISKINDLILDNDMSEDDEDMEDDPDIDPTMMNKEVLRLVVSVEISGLHGHKHIQHPLVVLSMNNKGGGADTTLGLKEIGRTEVQPPPSKKDKTRFGVTLSISCVELEDAIEGGGYHNPLCFLQIYSVDSKFESTDGKGKMTRVGYVEFSAAQVLGWDGGGGDQRIIPKAKVSDYQSSLRGTSVKKSMLNEKGVVATFMQDGKKYAMQVYAKLQSANMVKDSSGIHVSQKYLFRTPKAQTLLVEEELMECSGVFLTAKPMIELLLATRQEQVVRQKAQKDLLDVMRKKLQAEIAEAEKTISDATANSQAANSATRKLEQRRKVLGELEQVLYWAKEVDTETKEAIRRMQLGISTCEVREVVNKKRGIKNSFKPSTAKKNEEAMFLSTNLHMQQLWVTSENLRPKAGGPAGGDGYVPLVGIGVDAGNTFEQDSFMGGSGHRPKVVYDNVTVGCPSAHALGFKDMGLPGGVEQLKKESERMKEKKQQQAMDAKKPQSLHHGTQGSFELFSECECALLEVVGLKCNQYRTPGVGGSASAANGALAKQAEAANGTAAEAAADGTVATSNGSSATGGDGSAVDERCNVLGTGYNAETLDALSSGSSVEVTVKLLRGVIGVDSERQQAMLRMKVLHRMEASTTQAMCAMVAAFQQRVELAMMLANSAEGEGILKQMAEVGFLIQYESLLSTMGNELGMLGDTYCAIKSLALFAFRLVPESKWVSMQVPSASGGDTTTAPAAAAARKQAAPEAADDSGSEGGSEDEEGQGTGQTIIDDIIDEDRINIRVATAADMAQTDMEGIQYVIELKVPDGKDDETPGADGADEDEDGDGVDGDLVKRYVSAAGRVFQRGGYSKSGASLPESLAKGALIKPFCVLFTQGINEMQSYANMVDTESVGLQAEINAYFVQVLQRFVERFSNHWKEENPELVAAGSAGSGVVESKRAVVFRQLNSNLIDVKQAIRRQGCVGMTHCSLSTVVHQ
jgi:hypothetical protein